MTSELERVRQMSIEEAGRPRRQNIAYLKDVEVDSGTAVAIFSASGQQLALVPGSQYYDERRLGERPGADAAPLEGEGPGAKVAASGSVAVGVIGQQGV